MSHWGRDASAWLDEDGKHVWFFHKCIKGPETSMLPYPTWRAVDGHVEPSIVCNECRFHEIVPLLEPQP